MKHTPGPWEVYRLAPDSDPKQRHIVTANHGETEVCGIINNEADAPLIAAAPDLLEACKSWVKAYGFDRTFSEMQSNLEKLQQAIALAEGK